MVGKRGGTKRPVGGGAEFESFHTSYPAQYEKIDMVTTVLNLHFGRASTTRQAIGMAPIEKKRHRDLASFKAKKRQRIDTKNDDSQTGLDGGFVGLDKLPWNRVAVDRLEDAEGFFALEELSDVDVVKDPTLGKVEYKVGDKGV